MATVELKNVKKIYGRGSSSTLALKNINFKAENGEVVLIMGPSGAGKSTMLTIIGALQNSSEGQVLIDDEDITAWNEKKRSNLRLNKIGFVLQAHNLVPYLNVKDQFKLVDHVKKHGNLTKEELIVLLKDLDIANLIDKYPANLSGGQNQRVAIARAMYANPEILLADEPTASLDSQRVDEVGKLFERLAKVDNKLVVLVTHDPRLEKYANHIYDMLDGQLIKRK